MLFATGVSPLLRLLLFTLALKTNPSSPNPSEIFLSFLLATYLVVPTRLRSSKGQVLTGKYWFYLW